MPNEKTKESLILELLSSLHSGYDLMRISRILFEHLPRLLPVERLGIAVLSEDNKFLISKVNISDRPIWLREGFRVSLEKSSLKKLIDSRSARVISNLEDYLHEHPDSVSTRLVVNEGMRSNVSIPLIANDKAIGILFLADSKSDTYSSEHIDIVSHIGQIISLTVEKALLLERLQSQQQILYETLAEKEGLADQLKRQVKVKTEQLDDELDINRLLLKIARAINEGFTLDQVFERGCLALKEAFNFDCAVLLLINKSEAVAMQRGRFPPEFAGLFPLNQISLKESIVQEVYNSGQTIKITDLKPTRFAEDRAFVKTGMTAYAAVPLLIQNHVVGCALLASKNRFNIDQFPQRLMEGLSIQLTVALNHANIFEGMVANEKVLRLQNQHLISQISGDEVPDRMIGISSAIRDIKGAIKLVANTDSTVLILGETGSGKELVARGIHEESSRSDNPLISVNCSSLAPSIIESELFGHDKGAFTGAYREKVGRFELANSGTLFLDEIGELSLELQSKILRVLQEGTYERVGSSRERKTNARIIAATNRDLQQMIRRGLFREDLFYRLYVFPIEIPALRERPEDIIPLLTHFLDANAARMKRGKVKLDAASIQWALKYLWPGNVRELQNLVERAMIISQEPVISLTQAAQINKISDSDSSQERLIEPKNGSSWEDWERHILQETLRMTGGRIYGFKGAAQHLNLPPSTLQGKLKKLGLDSSGRAKGNS